MLAQPVRNVRVLKGIWFQYSARVGWPDRAVYTQLIIIRSGMQTTHCCYKLSRAIMCHWEIQPIAEAFGPEDRHRGFQAL